MSWTAFRGHSENINVGVETFNFHLQNLAIPSEDQWNMNTPPLTYLFLKPLILWPFLSYYRVFGIISDRRILSIPLGRLAKNRWPHQNLYPSVIFSEWSFSCSCYNVSKQWQDVSASPPHYHLMAEKIMLWIQIQIQYLFEIRLMNAETFAECLPF